MKYRGFFVVIGLILFTAQANAGLYSFARTYDESYYSPTVAVTLTKQADYVSMTLVIVNEQRDPVERATELKKTQNTIVNEAQKQKGIEILQGSLSLSATAGKWLDSRTSQVQVKVLTKLDKDTDVYDCVKRIRQFIASIKWPDECNYSLGEIQLAIKEPDQYRSEILKKIAEDFKYIKSSMSFAGKIIISGLENTVQIQQVDDKNVQLYIPYTMTFEVE